jgi:hypothetical protein
MEKGSFPKNEEVVLTKASPTTPVQKLKMRWEIYLQSTQVSWLKILLGKKNGTATLSCKQTLKVILMYFL